MASWCLKSWTLISLECWQFGHLKVWSRWFRHMSISALTFNWFFKYWCINSVFFSKVFSVFDKKWKGSISLFNSINLSSCVKDPWDGNWLVSNKISEDDIRFIFLMSFFVWFWSRFLRIEAASAIVILSQLLFELSFTTTKVWLIFSVSNVLSNETCDNWPITGSELILCSSWTVGNLFLLLIDNLCEGVFIQIFALFETWSG